MAFKLNNSDSYESLKVTLNEENYPIAFKNKVDELMEQKAFNSREEAEEWVRETPIELELYYEKDSGLFAVEAEAVESGTIYSPYTAELGEDYVDEED